MRIVGMCFLRTFAHVRARSCTFAHFALPFGSACVILASYGWPNLVFELRRLTETTAALTRLFHVHNLFAAVIGSL